MAAVQETKDEIKPRMSVTIAQSQLAKVVSDGQILGGKPQTYWNVSQDDKGIVERVRRTEGKVWVNITGANQTLTIELPLRDVF